MDRTDEVSKEARYACQQVADAEQKLAVGLGPIRERLREAFAEAFFAPVQDEDFPAGALREEVAWIKKTMRAKGTVPDTLAAMTDGEAYEVALRLYDLNYRLGLWLREHGENP